MSSTPRAQTGQPAGSLFNNSTSTKYNSWEENTKIKTCKCTVCDGRVRNTSQKCNGCGRHVCSDCLDPLSSKDQYYKDAAKDRVEQGCWACNWRSNMNPAFARQKPAPEVRTEEERKAKASKALGAARRASGHALAGQPSPASTPVASTENIDSGASSSTRASQATTPGITRSSGEQRPAATLTVSNSANALASKRKRYVDEDYIPDAELSGPDETVVIAKRAKRSMADQIPGLMYNQTKPPEEVSIYSPETSDIHAINPMSAATQPTDGDRPTHLEAGSTVIVGAGIVGLFIAYELASRLREAGIDHDVAFVEIRSSFCELASGACHGILTDTEMPAGCMPLAEVAQMYWQRLIADPDFQRDVYLGGKAVFSVKDGGGVDRNKAPSWFHGPANCSVVSMSDSSIPVDVRALHTWLYRQCMAMKVSTAFGSVVSGCKFGRDSSLTDVFIEKRDGCKGRLRCQNLILAAGPFTTGVLHGLCEGATELKNITREVHRLHAELNAVPDENDIAMLSPNAAESIPTFRDEIAMSAHPRSKLLTISAMDESTRLRHLGYELALQPRRAKTTELRKIAAQYLNHAELDVTDKKQHPRSDCSILSYASGSGPIIDEVPTSMLGLTSPNAKASERSGIWLCSGFGHHGTTLAPGAAEILVSRLFAGVKGGDQAFSIETCGVSLVEGKGRAKVLDSSI